MDQYLEEGNVSVNINAIVKKIDITIMRDSNITNGLYIKEILYKSYGCWKLRNVSLDYMHPYEYSNLTPPSLQYNNFCILKIFVDIYYNDFRTYQNVYHSLGGIYIQFDNMPFDIRRHLRNHFVLGFVPFSENFDNFI